VTESPSATACPVETGRYLPSEGLVVRMWPWGHLAVGYLLSLVALRFRRRGADGATVLLLAFGTQFPDVVDKPLTWLGALPGGRSLAHSLLVAIPLSVVVLAVARRVGRAGPVGGFVLGYGSHLLADSYHSLAAGRLSELTFLLWPVLALPEYERDSPLDHLDALVHAAERVDPAVALREPMGAFTGQVALFAIAGAIWVWSGAPGVGVAWRLLGRVPGRGRD
jgi:hypothetical protein